MNKVKEFRERYNLTQEDLAQKLKIDRSSVAKWESGENNPRLKYLFAMSSNTVRTSAGEYFENNAG